MISYEEIKDATTEYLVENLSNEVELSDYLLHRMVDPMDTIRMLSFGCEKLGLEVIHLTPTLQNPLPAELLKSIHGREFCERLVARYNNSDHLVVNLVISPPEDFFDRPDARKKLLEYTRPQIGVEIPRDCRIPQISLVNAAHVEGVG